MNKKDPLLVGVFGGIALWMLPVFIKSLNSFSSVFKGAGIFFMAAGVMYFIAFDQINNLITNRGKKSNVKGMTPQQQFELEKQKLENELALEKQKYELTKQKAAIAQLKQANSGGGLFGGYGGKMPDVLGNIGGVISGDRPKEEIKKKDNLDNLKDLF